MLIAYKRVPHRRYEPDAVRRSDGAFGGGNATGPWTTQTWIFDGTLKPVASSRSLDSLAEPAPATEQAVRMVYTSLGDNVFRREFERYQNGAWVTRSSGTCKRVSTP